MNIYKFRKEGEESRASYRKKDRLILTEVLFIVNLSERYNSVT